MTKIVDLDASTWKTPNDIYAALFKALGSPDWHGDSPDALIDSMIWGGINELEPPYRIRVSNWTALPSETLNHLRLIRDALKLGRQDFRDQEGHDIGVDFDVVGDATAADPGMDLPAASPQIVPERAARSIAIHLVENPVGLVASKDQDGEEKA